MAILAPITTREAVLSAASADRKMTDTGPVYRTLSVMADTFRPGVAMDDRTALTVPGFLSGLRFMAENLAVFPKHIYRKVTSGVRQRDHGHYLDFLLNDEPNPDQDAITFWSAFFGDAILGNGFAFVDFDGVKVAGLYHLPANIVYPMKVDGRTWYGIQVEPTGRIVPVSADQILHVQGFGDGVEGYSIVKLMAKSLRLAKSAEEYGAKYFEQGAGFAAIEIEKTLSPDQLSDIRASIAAQYSGLPNAHRTMILQAGMKAVPNSTTNDASQMIETRQFSILDIARMLRVEPFILYDYSESHYANLEAMNTALVTYSFMPWVVKLEQQINKKLFSTAERRGQGYYCGVSTESLLRGDPTGQNELAMKRLQAGISSIDEERALLDWQPLPDGAGARPRVAVNTAPVPTAAELATQAAAKALIAPAPSPAPVAEVPVTEPTQVTAKAQEPAPAPEVPVVTLATFGAMVRDAAGRVHRKTGMALANAQKKLADNPAGWVPWANTFAAEQADYAAAAIAPILERYGAVASVAVQHDDHGQKIGQKYGAALRGHLYAVGKGEETTAPDLARITLEHDLKDSHEE